MSALRNGPGLRGDRSARAVCEEKCMRAYAADAVFLVLLWCAVLGAASLASGTAWAGPELRIAVDNGYPPFSSVDAHGQLTGFDVDMAEALCHTMGRPCRFVPLSVEDIIAGMGRGELDLAFGVSPTGEAREAMDFSELYFRARSSYVGRAGVNMAEGRLRVGVRKDSVQERYLHQLGNSRFQVVSGSFVAVLEKLRAGEVDAVLGNTQAVFAFLKTDAGLSFVPLGEPVAVEDLPSFAYIGVRKGAGALLANVNSALIMLRYNGEFTRINRQYFPYHLY